jgi:hypothetical protein
MTVTVHECFAKFGVHSFMPLRFIRYWSVDSNTAARLLPEAQARMQSLLKDAAHLLRLAFSAWKKEHITPLLRELNWLKIKELIQFRLRVLSYRLTDQYCLSYLSQDLHLVAVSRRCLRSTSSLAPTVPAPRRSCFSSREL